MPRKIHILKYRLEIRGSFILVKTIQESRQQEIILSFLCPFLTRDHALGVNHTVTAPGEAVIPT
jgi:hypothetical protein